MISPLQVQNPAYTSIFGQSWPEYKANPIILFPSLWYDSHNYTFKGVHHGDLGNSIGHIYDQLDHVDQFHLVICLDRPKQSPAVHQTFPPVAIDRLDHWLSAVFHVDSLLNIANAGHPVGYGWTFLNFQLITMLYALLSTRTRAMTIVMMLIGGSWFILMMAWHQAWWVIFPMLLTVAAHHFADLLTTKRWLYYPFGFLFAIPAYVANYQALNGIDVGWPFLLGGYLLLEFALWETNWQFNSRVRNDRRLKKKRQSIRPLGYRTLGNSIKIYKPPLNVTRTTMNSTRYTLLTSTTLKPSMMNSATCLAMKS